MSCMHVQICTPAHPSPHQQALWHNFFAYEDFERVAGLLFLLLAASLRSDPPVTQHKGHEKACPPFSLATLPLEFP